ncbi:MAG: nuclear transport factor 2 family protein [Hymenobacter sp.]
MMQRDTATLRRLWSPALVVNNPGNIIVTVPQVLAFLRGGQIDYSSLERVVEKVTITGNVAVAMGHEVIKPQRKTSNAGHVVTRRYTDVWMWKPAPARLLARQATNVQVQ